METKTIEVNNNNFGYNILLGENKIELMLLPDFDFKEWIKLEENKDELKKKLNNTFIELNSFIDNEYKKWALHQ